MIDRRTFGKSVLAGVTVLALPSVEVFAEAPPTARPLSRGGVAYVGVSAEPCWMRHPSPYTSCADCVDFTLAVGTLPREILGYRDRVEVVPIPDGEYFYLYRDLPRDPRYPHDTRKYVYPLPRGVVVYSKSSQEVAWQGFRNLLADDFVKFAVRVKKSGMNCEKARLVIGSWNRPAPASEKYLTANGVAQGVYSVHACYTMAAWARLAGPAGDSYPSHHVSSLIVEV